MNDFSLITVTFTVPDSVKKDMDRYREVLCDKYSLNNSLPESHITIYQCKTPTSLLKETLQSIDSLVVRNSSFTFSPIGPNIKNKFIGIGYEKSEDIYDFHKSIIDLLNPLRMNEVRSTFIDKRELYSSEEQKNIDSYGYPFVMDEYKPHIALVAFPRAEDALIFDPNLLSDLKSFQSSSITVIVRTGDGITAKIFSQK